MDQGSGISRPCQQCLPYSLHVCVRWLTQPTLSSPLTVHSRFGQPLWQVQRFYSSTSVPPIPLQPCLSHPHALPVHKDEFQDFQNSQAVKLVSGIRRVFWTDDGGKYKITRLTSQVCHLSPVLLLGVKGICRDSELGTSRAPQECARISTSALPPACSGALCFLELIAGCGSTEPCHVLSHLMQVFDDSFSSVKVTQNLRISMPGRVVFRMNAITLGKAFRASLKWEAIYVCKYIYIIIKWNYSRQ